MFYDPPAVLIGCWAAQLFFERIWGYIHMSCICIHVSVGMYIYIYTCVYVYTLIYKECLCIQTEVSHPGGIQASSAQGFADFDVGPLSLDGVGR